MTASNEFRVFISSTFRDLQEEREHLIKKIFPEIRSLCRERGITFTEVDLRWGLTDEQSALGQIIRTCLEEIDRCRPYFIGIIGNRYGWAPAYYEIAMDPELLAKYPWIEQAAFDEVSVTEMEFIHGIFNSPSVEGHSVYFYRRDGDLRDADEPEKLRRMIERVTASGHPMQAFITAEELGRMVHDDLIGMIDRYWSQTEAPSPLELRRRAHRAFAASRRRAYIAQPEHLKRFNEFMESRVHGVERSKTTSNSTNSTNSALVIVGDSGSGKSSLVAHLVEHYRRTNPTAFVIEHYVGSSQQSGSALAVMRHVVEEIRERFAIEEEIPSKPEQLEREFANWLYRAGHLARQQGVPMLIVLDALNQLDEQGRRLAWLRGVIPPGIKLIVSMTREESYDRLRDRGWEELEVLPLLDERLCASIVVRCLAEFHKSISAAQLQRIASDEKATSPLYLRVVAEELRLHGEHETLDEVIERYRSADDLDEVFQRMLERMEGDYGVLVIERMMSLLWASRAGLSEAEVLDLTGAGRLDLSRVLFALDYHLIRHDGLLGFFHDYLRRAVAKRYLADEGRSKQSYEELARYFERASPSERGTLEMLHALEGMNAASKRVLAVLASRERLLPLLATESRYEMLRQCALLRQREDCLAEAVERALLAAADPQAEGSIDDLKSFERVGSLLRDLGYWNSAVELFGRQRELAEERTDRAAAASALAALGWLERLRGENEAAEHHLHQAIESFEELGDRSDLALAIGRIGSVFFERGEYDRALECCRQQEELCRELGDRNGLSYAIGNMGGVFLSYGEYDRALECYRQQEEICRELGDRSGVSLAIGNMGVVYTKRGEHEHALECYRQKEEICRELGDRIGLSIAIGNMGLVVADRGEYDRAMECWRQQEKISRELGDRIGLSAAIGNMGSVFCERGEYERALECFRRAGEEHRAIGFRYGLSDWLEGTARVLLELVEAGGEMPEYLSTHLPNITVGTWHAMSLQAARESAEECVAISEELSKPDALFSSRVLHARIEAAEGGRDVAVQRLQQMLEKATDDEQRAELHFWLCKLLLPPLHKGRVGVGSTADAVQDAETPSQSPPEAGGEEGKEEVHRTEALRLYRQLVKRTPKHEYKQRIEELTADTSTPGATDAAE
jgi:tetratricopeptide (TPR) repeat protein